jgi:Cu/Ag efflux protein CusF
MPVLNTVFNPHPNLSLLMKTARILLPVLPLFLALVPSVGFGLAHEGCTCGSKSASTDGAPVAMVAETSSAGSDEKKEAPARHPLKGVVIEIMSERSGLLVKHEEIPGVMKAMTMLLKVDEASLASVKKGDAVTGMLVRKTDGWWLEDVKTVGRQ